MEKQLDDQIAKVDNVNVDDLEKLHECRLRQDKLQIEKKKQWDKKNLNWGHSMNADIIVCDQWCCLS